MASHFNYIKIRRGSKKDFDTNNLTLKDGEPAIALDKQVFKIGDGNRSWKELPSFLSTQQFKSKVATVNVPSLTTGDTYTATITIDGVESDNHHYVAAAPVAALPDNITISYAYVSNDNQVSIKFANSNIENIDGGDVTLGTGESAFTATIAVVVYLIQDNSATESVSITSDIAFANEAYSFGAGEFGQLVLNSTVGKNIPVKIVDTKTWRTLTAGDYHSLGIDSSGNLYSCGYNYYGQLGLLNDGPGTNRKQFEKISTKYNEYITKSNGAIQSISDKYLMSHLLSDQNIWSKVDGGSSHTLALDNAGYLYSFGSNQHGILGLGHNRPRNYPVMVSLDPTKEIINLELYTNATIKYSDADSQYSLNGYETSNFNGTKALAIPSGKMFTVECSHPIAFVDDNSNSNTDISSYAVNRSLGSSLGLTGDDANRTFHCGPISISGAYETATIRILASGNRIDTYQLYETDPNSQWTDISAGSFHSLGIRDGKLYAWGNNTFGQVGQSDLDKHYNTPTLISTGNTTWSKVAAGNRHSLAIDSNGDIWSWGENSHGQLGIGSTVDQNSPVKIFLSANDGKQVVNMSEDSFMGWDEGTQTKHVFNLEEASNLAVYDANKVYALQSGTYNIYGVPSGYPIAFLNNGKDHLFSYSGDILQHSGIVISNTDNDGTYNFYSGKITITVSGDFDQVSLYGYGVSGYGSGDKGYMGGQGAFRYIDTAEKFRDISAGSDASVALSTHKRMYVFGSNEQGKIGLNNIHESLTPFKLEGRWDAMSMGANHLLAVNEFKELWATGKNDKGQLGLGDSIERRSLSRLNSNINWYKPYAGGSHSIVTVYSFYPKAPTNFTVRNASSSVLAGNQQIYLSWDCDSSIIDGVKAYPVEVSDDDGITWTAYSYKKSLNPEKFKSVTITDGSPRKFRVKSLNDVGSSDWVESVNITATAHYDNDYCDTALLLHLDNNTALNRTYTLDSSKNAFSTTGNVAFTPYPGNFGTAIKPQGLITYNTSNGYADLDGNFALEFYVKNIDRGHGVFRFMETSDNSTQSLELKYMFDYAPNNTDIQLTLELDLYGPNGLSISDTVTHLQDWNYIKVERSGSVNTLYLNRSEIGNVVEPSVVTHDINYIEFGSTSNSLLLDEIRLSKITRDSEITREFGDGDPSITCP